MALGMTQALWQGLIIFSIPLLGILNFKQANFVCALCLLELVEFKIIIFIVIKPWSS